MKTGVNFVRLIIMLLLLSILLGTPQTALTDTLPTVAIWPAHSNACTSGQIFVAVTNGLNLVGYEVHLSFTPGIINVSKVENGPFIADGIDSPINAIDNTLGKVVFGNVIYGQDAVSGSGNLMTIYYDVVQIGQSVAITIDPEASDLVDISYIPDMVEFSVSNGTLSTSCEPPQHSVFLPLIRR